MAVRILKKRGFWVFAMLLVLSSYMGLIICAFFAKNPGVFIAVLLLIFLIHILEIRTAISAGRAAGCSVRRIISMNMLFGFVWWLPLKWGVWPCRRG